MEVMGSLTGLEMLINKTIEKCLLVYDLDSEDTEDVLDDLERTWPDHPASRRLNQADPDIVSRQEKHVLKDFNCNTSDKVIQTLSSRQANFNYVTARDQRNPDDAVQSKRPKLKEDQETAAQKESGNNLAAACTEGHEPTSGKSPRELIKTDDNSGHLINNFHSSTEPIGRDDVLSQPITELSEMNDVRAIISRQERGSSSSPELHGSKSATSRHPKLKSRLQQRYFEDSHDSNDSHDDEVNLHAEEVRKDVSNGCAATTVNDQTIDASKYHSIKRVDNLGLGHPGSVETDHAAAGNLDLLARAVSISRLQEEQMENRRQQEWAELEITRHFIGGGAARVTPGHSAALHQQMDESNILHNGSLTPVQSHVAREQVNYLCTSGLRAENSGSVTVRPETDSQKMEFGDVTHVVASGSGVSREHPERLTPITPYPGTDGSSSTQQSEVGAGASDRTSRSLEPASLESEEDLDKRARVLLEHYQKGFHAARESVVLGRGLEGVFGIDQGLPKIAGTYDNHVPLFTNVPVESPELQQGSNHDRVRYNNSNSSYSIAKCSSNSNSSNDSYTNGDSHNLQTGSGPHTNGKLSDSYQHQNKGNSISSIQELIAKQERLNHKAFEFDTNSYTQKVSADRCLTRQIVPRASHSFDSGRNVQYEPTISYTQLAQLPSSTPKIRTSPSRISSIILEELQKETQTQHDSTTSYNRTINYTSSPIPQTKIVTLIQHHGTDPAQNQQTFQSTSYTQQNTTTVFQRARHTPTNDEQQEHVTEEIQHSPLISPNESRGSPANFVPLMSLAHAHSAKPSTPSHLRYPHSPPASSHDRPTSHDMPTDLSLHSRKRSSDSANMEPPTKSICGYPVSGHGSLDYPRRTPQAQGNRQNSSPPSVCIPPLGPQTYPQTVSIPPPGPQTYPQTVSPAVSKSKGEFAADQLTHITLGQLNGQLNRSVLIQPRAKESRSQTDHIPKHSPGLDDKLLTDKRQVTADKLLTDKRRMATLARWTEARNKECELQRDYS